MKVIVNMPTNEKDIKDLEDRAAKFKAQLIVESIKKLNISSADKKKVLKGIYEECEI